MTTVREDDYEDAIPSFLYSTCPVYRSERELGKSISDAIAASDDAKTRQEQPQ